MASMVQLLHSLKRAQGKKIGPPREILGMVQDWKGKGQNVAKSLADWVAEVESREKELILVGESLEKKLKDLEKRELGLKEKSLSPFRRDSGMGIELREEKLDEQLKSVTEHIASLEAAYSEVDGVRRRQCDKLKRIGKREKEVDSMHVSLEKRLREVEQREKEIDGRLRELVRDEEILSLKKEEFDKEVELAKERFRENEKSACGLIERLALALDMLNCMKVTVDAKFREIESWEATAHESLSARLYEADLIQESLEKGIGEFEKLEKEFITIQEGKMRMLEEREDRFNSRMRKREEREDRLNSRTRKLDEGEDRLNIRTRKLEEGEDQLNITARKLEEGEDRLNIRTRKLEEAEDQLNIRTRKLEEGEGQLNIKMRKLEEREDQLNIRRKELRKEVKLRDEKLIEMEKLGRQLVESFDETVAMKLKQIESQELALEVDREKSVAIAKEADSKMESANTRLQELEKREENFQLYHQKKERELVVAEEKLRLIGEEFLQTVKSREDEFDKQEKLVCGLLQRLEISMKNVRDMNAVVREKFKAAELNNIKNQRGRKIDELESNARESGSQKKETKAKGDCSTSERNGLEGKKTKFGLKDQKIGTHLKECESIRHGLANALDAKMKTEPVESLHLKPTVQIDVNTLHKLINDTEKDFELVAGEVFKVLLLSPDPAKLVLHEIEGFCRCHLGRRDVELKKRRMVILLLDQLIKMSPKIQDCVREDAISIASEWQSKMRTTPKHSLEVLGFLHLLAAYNLIFNFDSDEVVSLLKMVAQHERTPELWRILGFTVDVPGFIRTLINEKQYLLASIYIHECELEYMFPQGAVLDYYLKHSKMSAKATCKKEHYSSEAQDKAIVCEIADLRLAIDHIIKYGLESECSPNILAERINQLEGDRASLRRRMPSSSTDVRKQEKCREGYEPRDVNKRKATRDVDQKPMTPPSHSHKRLRTSNIHHRLRRQP